MVWALTAPALPHAGFLTGIADLVSICKLGSLRKEEMLYESPPSRALHFEM